MKKALLFLPNIITVFRIILTFLFAEMLISGLVRNTTKMPTVIYAVFIFICLSDFFDGIAARGLKAESTIGGILDISADSLFIFSSLVIFNIFRVLPVWFTVVVLVDFMQFLATSRFLVRTKRRDIRRFFVFDMTGRIAAILFYFIPFASCMVYCHPGYEGLLVLNALLYMAVFLACISMLGRCMSCFAALRRVSQNSHE